MLYDLIIIGGGPAGITAGIYAARKKLKTLLITKDFLGQVGKTNEIDNYLGFPKISGMGLMKEFEKHLKKFEVDIKEQGKVKKIKKQGKSFLIKTDSGKEFYTKTIIIATGGDPRPLEVPGENEFIGKGVSYCSICDAPFYKDKGVIVVGGGNSGFEAALDLAKYAKRVFIFEKSDKIIADEILQKQVKKESRIQVYLNKDMEKIEGNKTVHSAIYKDSKTGKTFQVPAHGVFIQIGSIPATGFLKGLCKFNKRDEIKVDFETCATSCPGIFAAGDANNGRWKQIIIAAGEGARAALSAHKYLQQ
jgi:thioredoxin-disulfide reductase